MKPTVILPPPPADCDCRDLTPEEIEMLKRDKKEQSRVLAALARKKLGKSAPGE